MIKCLKAFREKRVGNNSPFASSSASSTLTVQVVDSDTILYKFARRHVSSAIVTVTRGSGGLPLKLDSDGTHSSEQPVPRLPDGLPGLLR